MRALHIVGLLVLGIIVIAFAQFADPATPADEPVDEVQAIKQRAPESWLTTSCLADWDAQTHMTMTEWRRTCERVSRERADFQLNTPSVLSVGVSARGPRKRVLD
jgi:hypothetical protein